MALSADQQFLDAIDKLELAAYNVRELCNSARRGTTAYAVNQHDASSFVKLRTALNNIRLTTNGMQKALQAPKWAARYESCATAGEVLAFVEDVVTLQEVHVFSEDIFEMHEPGK